MCLAQSFPTKSSGKARPKTGFHFNVHKRPVPESSGASLAKRPPWQVGLRLVHVAGSLLVVLSASSADARKKGAMGVGTPDVSQSTASSPSSSSVLQVCMLSHFWISGEALLQIGLCLIWYRVTIFSLGHVLLVPSFLAIQY